jgi:hypothetical protein
MQMEIAPVLTWLAAGAIGILAVAALIRTFEAVFDLDHG